MISLNKVLGLGATATVASLFAFAALSVSSQATTTRIGVCESATVPGVIQCCKRLVQTPAGHKWLFNGASCGSRYVTCVTSGGDIPGIAVTHVAKKKVCYLNKKPIILQEKHKDTPNDHSNNSTTGGQPGRGGNGKP